MKIKFIAILIVFASQIMFSQTMKVYKTDLTTVEFNLTDIDSIKITTSTTGSKVSLTDWNLNAGDSNQLITNTSSPIYQVNEHQAPANYSAQQSGVNSQPVSEMYLNILNADSFIRTKKMLLQK